MLELQPACWISRANRVFSLDRIPKIPGSSREMVRYDFSPNVAEKLMRHCLVDIGPRDGSKGSTHNPRSVFVEGGWVVSDRGGGVKSLTRYGTEATWCGPLRATEGRVPV